MKPIFAVIGAAAFVLACSDSSTAPPGGGGPPNPTLSNLGSMNVGDVRILTFAQASAGLTIPAELAAGRYALVVSNTAVNSGGAARSYSVQSDWLSIQTSGPVADVFPPPTRTVQVVRGNPRGEAFEASLRSFERTRLPRPGGQRQLSGAAADKLVPNPALAAAPPVGTTLSIKVLNPAGFAGGDNINCTGTGYTTTNGTVRAVGAHAIVVSDVTSPAGGFSTADFNQIASEFDSLIYPTDVGYFGTPTDLDQNGHIIIYYTPAVNRITPTGQATVSGYVGGFFFAGDLYPATGTNSCASSNRGEIFYLLAPDPNGVNGNTFSAAFVRQVTRGTVAHEFQHMINSGNRFASPSISAFEATWLDEGLAHFAEDAVGRVAAGFGDGTAVTFNQISALPDSLLQGYFLQNFARAKYYVERPDTSGPITSSAKAAANLSSRGAEWALVRYAADWFSGSNPRAVTLKLVAGPDTGTVNFAKASGVPMDTVLARWLTTMFTDHKSIPNINAVYNYKSYTLRQLIAGTLLANETTASYLPVNAIGNGSSNISVTVPASSAAYFETSLGATGARTITVNGSGGSPATDTNGRIYVIREQ